MPLKLQGSSTLMIQPCFDGKMLPITPQMASDGLALLSIKDPHRDCTLVQDSGSRKPTLSCARGIKARNSYWNLHKPDLRRIKGLECTTTNKAIDLFQAHNVESTSTKSYGKKVISKLGSIISKKSKPTTQPQVLVRDVFWPVSCCVLSTVCQETELVIPEVLKNVNPEKTIKKHNFSSSPSNMIGNDVKDTIFITLPSFNMHENTSEDFFPVSELSDPSNGDSYTKTSPLMTGRPGVYLECNGSCEVGTPQQAMSSSIILESKKSQLKISIPSNVDFYKEKAIAKSGIQSDIDNHQDDGTKQVTENPSSVVVQSIFSDIFHDIEEIKDVIDSYMSSFYVKEEEYSNFPTIHTPSKEVASYFFEQINKPLNKNTCNPREMHSSFCKDSQENKKTYCYSQESSIIKEADATVSQAVDIDMTRRDDLQENYVENISQCEKDKPHYCYWEDNDLVGELSSDKLLGKEEERNKTTAIVPHEFIENMWEEFTKKIETHALFIDLVQENEKRKFEQERNIPSYGYWAGVYDPQIFQEAENIVHSLDNLLRNGCFPGDEGNNTAYIPCTIMELVDESEFHPSFEYGVNDNEDMFRDKNLDIEEDTGLQEVDTIIHKETEKCILNDSLASEKICTKNVHKIKLEPVLYQEKFMIQEIEYSRVPKYQKFLLDSINHQERVDSLTLQSNGSKHLTASGINDPNSEPSNRHDKPEENLPKRFKQENQLNNDCFSEDDSKSHLTPQTIDEKTIFKNNLDNPNTSMFEKIQEKNSHGNPNPAFMFSSPTLQLNLTNPFANPNKK